MILRRAERNRLPAVAQHEERHLGTREALLDDDARAGLAELTLLHHGANGGVGLGAVGGNDDALSGREAVGLDHDRQAELAARDHACGLGGGIADAKPRRRDAVARHERLRERLAALELSRGARGTDDAMAARAKAIDDAKIERQLGTDDRQIETLAIGERRELVNRA